MPEVTVNLDCGRLRLRQRVLVLLLQAQRQRQEGVAAPLPGPEGEAAVKERVARVPDVEEGDFEVLGPLLTRPRGVQRLDAQAEALVAVRHRHAFRLAEEAAVVATLGLGGVRQCVVRILEWANWMEKHSHFL